MESIFVALILGWIFFRWLRASRQPPTFVSRANASAAQNEESPPAEASSEMDSANEPSFWCAPSTPATGRYRITYVDADGNRTDREIVALSVLTAEGRSAIYARCLLRGQNRTFIERRIVSAVNLETGEAVDSVAADAMRNYSSSDESKAWSMIAGESDAVAALIYVARADGQMRKPERLIIAEYLGRKTPSADVDAGTLDDVIKQCHGPYLPRDFEKLIKALISEGDKENVAILLNYAERIVNTQKSVHPQEMASIAMIRRIIEKS